MKVINVGNFHNVVLLKNGTRALFMGELCAALLTPDGRWYRNSEVVSTQNKKHVSSFLRFVSKQEILIVNNRTINLLLEDV